jgi:hypothetical protein
VPETQEWKIDKSTNALLFWTAGHPELTEIDTKYDPKTPFHQQIHAALVDLKAKFKHSRTGELKNLLHAKCANQKYQTKTFRYYRPQNYAIVAKETDFSQQDIEPTVLEFEEAILDPKESRIATAANEFSQASPTTNKQVRFQDDHISGDDHRKLLTFLENVSDEDVPDDYRQMQVNSVEPVVKRRNYDSKQKAVQENTSGSSVKSGRAAKVSRESSEKSCRRSRKKTKSGLHDDPKGSLNVQIINKRNAKSVLEVISFEKEVGKETTRKRKFSLSSTLSHKAKDTKTDKNANDIDHLKRRKAKLEAAKYTTKRHSLSRQGNENAREDKKSTKERTSDCIEKLPKSTGVVDMGGKKHISSRHFDFNGHQNNQSDSIIQRGTTEHRQQKDRHERRDEDISTRHIEGKPMGSCQVKHSVYRGNLKATESRDRQSRTKENKDPSHLKKEEPRKRLTKTKSSFATSKGDDASNGSKLSKSRRSRKKSGGSQNFLTSGGMDYDFGFKF